MRRVDVLQAQIRLEELVEEAEPVAMLVSYRGAAAPRRLGGWEGKVWMAPDFDEYDEEIRRMFEEGEVEPPP